MRECFSEHRLGDTERASDVVQLIAAAGGRGPQHDHVARSAQPRNELHPAVAREEGRDVHVRADELHQLVGVRALLGAEIGVVHVVDDAGDRLLIVLLRLGRPPLRIGRGKVGLCMYDLVPLLAVVADACDDHDGRPRVLVAAGADQKVLDERGLAVAGWCAQGHTGASRHRTRMLLGRGLVVAFLVLGLDRNHGR